MGGTSRELGWKAVPPSAFRRDVRGTLAKLPGFGWGWTGTARGCRPSPTPKPSPWPCSSRLCCPLPRSFLSVSAAQLWAIREGFIGAPPWGPEPGRLMPTRRKCGGDVPFTASDREQTLRGSFQNLLPHFDRIPLLP